MRKDTACAHHGTSGWQPPSNGVRLLNGVQLDKDKPDKDEGFTWVSRNGTAGKKRRSDGRSSTPLGTCSSPRATTTFPFARSPRKSSTARRPSTATFRA